MLSSCRTRDDLVPVWKLEYEVRLGGSMEKILNTSIFQCPMDMPDYPRPVLKLYFNKHVV